MKSQVSWAKLPISGVVCAAFALSGCVGGGDAAVNGAAANVQPAALAEIQPTELNGEPSAVIENLIARQSVLTTGSSFDTVADAVLATNARTAESELRAARLRAQAKSRNWLPSIGPVISLTSLGDIVASLVVEQVLYDHGRKRAERDFAAHDVEVAAVSLSQSTNSRVATALELYINAQRAAEEAKVAANAKARMGQLVNIIQRRVDGGVSNMADLSVGRAKIHELDAELSRAREAQSTALAELEAMTRAPMGDVSGLSPMGIGTAELKPLNVLKAQAEGDRTVARAKIARADLLPGVTAGGTVGDGGSDISVQVSGNQLVDLGTGSSLKAIEVSQEAALRGVVQAQEDNQRIINRLTQKRAALERQQTESAALVAEARRTYRLFYNQFENSGRPIMDVVNIYENVVRQERDAVRLKYELAQIQVEIASLYGTLVSGDDV
ncbi:MAG: TolC family protein [Planktomarina sp.]